MHQEKVIPALIQLAPNVLALASEAQAVLGIYEVVSSSLKGNRVDVYKSILTLVRSKFSPPALNNLVTCMQSAVTAIELADKVKDLLVDIIKEYSNVTSKDNIDGETKQELDFSDVPLEFILEHEALGLVPSEECVEPVEVKDVNESIDSNEVREL